MFKLKAFLRKENKMIRKGFVMQVFPDKHKEYEDRHNPIWEELHAVLKAHGVTNYSIFLNITSNQLFGYAEIENEDQWNQIAHTVICKKWWKYMADLMPSNLDSSPISEGLKEVFHID